MSVMEGQFIGQEISSCSAQAMASTSIAGVVEFWKLVSSTQTVRLLILRCSEC